MKESFSGVLTFSFMVFIIWFGALLRRRFRLLQLSLFPASIVGGLLGSSLLNLGWAPSNQTSEDFVVFAFHFFTLSFMSLALTRESGSESGVPSRSTNKLGALWLSVAWTVSLAMQALVGLVGISLANYFSEQTLPQSLGILVTHGFTQGPGQALAMASIWQEQYSIENAVNFGLIYASVGFIIAFVVGIPIASWALRRNLNENKEVSLSREFVIGFYRSENRPETGRNITHSSNVDSLVYHLGLLGFAYLATDAYLIEAQEIFKNSSFLGFPVVILFSHNLFFVHGLLICLLLRTLIAKLRLDHLLDVPTQKHITGSSVDLMIVATIMSIQISFLLNYLLPIVLVCVLVTLATLLLCFGFGRRLKTLKMERSLALFGCCTGSTGSGLLLLRLLDPNFSTSVSKELVYFNALIIFLSMHILLFIAPLTPSIDLIYLLVIYILTCIVGFFILFILSPRT
ncbi:sodium:glutamate symporter [Gammaproteobacteria bacterium]|nr:sodium:glutamate symporter [Gammaproteobacteria bacterium]